MTGRAGTGALRPLRTADAAPTARHAPVVSPLVVPSAPDPLADTVTGSEWRRLSACAVVDPEVFFPVEYRREDLVRPARRVCGRCPVRAACLADVMATEDPARRHGVCGGTTPEERSALFRAGLAVVPASPAGGAA